MSETANPTETASAPGAPARPDLLAVLAEPNRRRLLELLRGGEHTVTELAAEFSVTRPAVSQHLGVLAGAGLVEARQDGRFRRYRLVPVGMAALRSTLDAYWTTELEDLASVEPPVTPASPKEGSPQDD